LLGGVVHHWIGSDVDALRADRAAGDAATTPRALDRAGRWNQDGEQKSAIWLRTGIIGGFAATIIMSIALVIGYLAAGIFADQDASTVSGWFYGLTHNSLTDDTFEIPIGAYGLNLLAGVIWALIYAAFFERRLKGPGWWRGMTFALLPWLLSLVVFFPVVGAGFFGVALEAGPLPVVGNLVLHLVYGASLGALYLSLTTSGEAARGEDRLLQAGWIDHGIAVGLAGGLMVGLILGAFAGVLVDPGGVSATEMTLAGAAIGVLGGLLVGPLAGLETGSSQNATPAG
jgi:MFS family permease